MCASHPWRASDTLELTIQMVLSCVWVLEIKPSPLEEQSVLFTLNHLYWPDGIASVLQKWYVLGTDSSEGKGTGLQA